MTDLKKAKDLFDQFGVKYREEETIVHDDIPVGTTMIFEQDYDEKSKIVGYGGFVMELYFHSDGSFSKMGIWE